MQKSPQQIRKEVLDAAWESANGDGAYLENLIEWAYRDYKDDDFLSDWLTMELDKKEL